MRSVWVFFVIIFAGAIRCLETFGWDVGNSYIISTIQNVESERSLNRGRLGDWPPIKSNPPEKERTIKNGEVPDYALEYAPLIHLYTEERYYPYDIGDYVTHFCAKFANGSTLKGTEFGIRIAELSQLPKNKEIFLTSLTDFDKDPDWITGVHNEPSLIDGKIANAPATVIVVDKGNGWVDVFWFYFYSFNLGPFVMGAGPYGNHVGDWEHSLVRFYKGKPVIVWMSAHGGGQAYNYSSLEKYELNPRNPILFSARGTHANYVSVGQQPHDLPYDILSDFTDRGALWNPTKNYLGYTFDGKRVYPCRNNANNEHKGREIRYGNWLSFTGCWGDKQLLSNDSRQEYLLIGGHKYINGPEGPLLKNLLRVSPCQRFKWWNFWKGCKVRNNIKWGIGVEAEGFNCGNIFLSVKHAWLKKILQHITWGGGLCFIMDLLYG